MNVKDITREDIAEIVSSATASVLKELDIEVVDTEKAGKEAKEETQVIPEDLTLLLPKPLQSVFKNLRKKNPQIVAEILIPSQHSYNGHKFEGNDYELWFYPKFVADRNLNYSRLSAKLKLKDIIDTANIGEEIVWRFYSFLFFIVEDMIKHHYDRVICDYIELEDDGKLDILQWLPKIGNFTQVYWRDFTAFADYLLKEAVTYGAKKNGNDKKELLKILRPDVVEVSSKDNTKKIIKLVEKIAKDNDYMQISLHKFLDTDLCHYTHLIPKIGGTEESILYLNVPDMIKSKTIVTAEPGVTVETFISDMLNRCVWAATCVLEAKEPATEYRKYYMMLAKYLYNLIENKEYETK